jgi:hypothetical protein
MPTSVRPPHEPSNKIEHRRDGDIVRPGGDDMDVDTPGHDGPDYAERDDGYDGEPSFLVGGGGDSLNEVGASPDGIHDPGIIPDQNWATSNTGRVELASEVGILGEHIDLTRRQISDEAANLTGSNVRLREVLGVMEAAAQGTSSSDLLDGIRAVQLAVEHVDESVEYLNRAHQIGDQYLRDIGWDGGPSLAGQLSTPAPSESASADKTRAPARLDRGDSAVSERSNASAVNARVEFNDEHDQGLVPSALTEADWDAKAPLRWLLPELGVIQNRSSVLADDSRTASEHAAAARDVIDALRIGVRGLLNSRPHLTESPDATFHQMSPVFLASVGEKVNEAVQSQGLSWPPPQHGEGPSATSDLIFLYQCASDWTSGAERPAPQSLLVKMLEVEKRSALLLAHWDDDIAREVARSLATTDDKSPRARIGTLLSGAALAISLIQGPGALHDLPEDIRALGGDIAEVAAVVTAALCWIIDRLWSLITSIIA